MLDDTANERISNPPKSNAVMSSGSSTEGDDVHEMTDVDANGHHALEAQKSRTESIWLASTFTLPREALFVSIVCLAQFCTQMGLMSVLTILHTIGDDFGITSAGQLSWLVAGYSLTVGTFILVSGRLGDIYGYKLMLLIGLVWYSIWSIIAGCSVYVGYVLFVFSRVFQGIGPAICLPNALALLGAAYPPGHRKAMVFSFFGATAPVGGILGAAFAAAISLAWWPWVMWMLAIMLAIMVVVGYFVIPSPPHQLKTPSTIRELWTELDIPGSVTGVTALVLFNFAWNQAPLVGWAAPEVIVTLILGIAIFALFYYIEMHVSPMPLLPLDSINADVGFVLGAVCCGWASFGIWTLYFMEIVQRIRHLSPLMNVAWLSPVIILGIAASVLTGYLLGPAKVKPPFIMAIALLAFTTGLVITATTDIHTVYWAQYFIGILIIPFGMDMSFPAATIILSNAVKKEHQGIAASLVNTVVNYGISLGVGFAGTVEMHVNNGGKTEADQLKGYQGALYMGVGMAGLGLVISLVYLATHFKQLKAEKSEAEEE